MTKRDAPFIRFASKPGAYKSWGEVRRRNLISRLMNGMIMTFAGISVMVGLVIMALFAASLAVIGAAAVGIMGLTAVLTRARPAKVRVSAEDGKGVYVARKTGSTWTVY